MILDKSNEKISGMFDAIAPTYDKLNHVLSFNTDKKWRKKAIDELMLFKPKSILDVATGSGDMVIEIIQRANLKISAIDISKNMIRIAEDKIRKLSESVDFFISPAEQIPFSDHTFDAATIAFGVRNFEHIENGLSEIKRVLKDEGHLVILEFIKPRNKLLKIFIDIYLKGILPIIGKLVSKNKNAYQYLNQSIQSFYTSREFEDKCIQVGYQKVKTRILFMGLVAIFVLKK